MSDAPQLNPTEPPTPPADRYEAPLRPHVYDGIQEFDNRLPNWWLWTLYAAIIFSVLYWYLWYQGAAMESDSARVTAAMNRIEEARLANVGDISNDTLWAMSRNPGFVSSGQAVFTATCTACHGANLEGGIGLNLVDGDWKWGNTPMSVYEVVANGSPDVTKGMQAWMNQLGPQKVSQVVAYILSHHNPEAMAAANSENPPLVP